MTTPTLPKVVASVTVSPPVVRLFPLMSFSCIVMVEVDTPSAVIEAGAAVIRDVVTSATPGVIVTEAVSVTAVVFTVPEMVAVPVVVEVSIAV